MNQTASKPTTPSKAAASMADHDNLVTQFELPLILFLLKKLSSEKHPLSVREITNYMNDLTTLNHSEKTIRRKLQNLCTLQSDEDSLISNSLFLSLGGRVEEVISQHPQFHKPQTSYYFQPLLDVGDVSMICGAITSNRYLTDSEKDYLISREQLLTFLKNDVKAYEEILTADKKIVERRTYNIFTETPIPEKPVSEQEKTKPANLLHRINQLHDAIEKGYVIQVTYGIYTLDQKNKKKISLLPRNPNAYLLNPYALLWNGGFYYLLATHKGHDNPVHFRVDRILNIQPLQTEQEDGCFEPRAALPESLSQYFRTNEDQKPEFLPEKYTAMYPLMGIYDEADRISCQLECTESTLSILIDTFGSNLSISSSPLPHSDDELDIHGNPQEFFSVQIPNVQYDNLLQFCLQQHASITPLYPPKLIDDVESGLKAALERCQKARSKRTK